MENSAINNFLCKIDELHSYIKDNKAIVIKKQYEYKELLKQKQQINNMLQMKELHYSFILKKRTGYTFEVKKYAYLKHLLEQECNKLTQKLDSKKISTMHLKKKIESFQVLISEEQNNWNNHINSLNVHISNECSTDLQSILIHVNKLNSTLQEHKAQLTQLQDEFDMLLIEKLIQQDTTNELSNKCDN